MKTFFIVYGTGSAEVSPKWNITLPYSIENEIKFCESIHLYGLNFSRFTHPYYFIDVYQFSIAAFAPIRENPPVY